MSSKVLSSRDRRSARISLGRSVPTKLRNSFRRSNGRNADTPARNTRARVTRSQQSNLLSLNDDCISKILSHLELNDLFALNDSYPKLGYLTYLAAEKRFRKNGLICLRINRDVNAVKILKKFGKFITHLCIDGENSFSDLCPAYQDDWNSYQDGYDFGAMMRNCGSLKSVKFRKVHFWNAPVWKLRNIFQQIETLVLEDCNGITQKIAPLLNVCKSLKHLILEPNDRTREPADLFSSIVEFGPEIETIRLKMDSTYEAAQFLKFLKRLEKLEKLKTLELGLIWEYPMTARINHALASLESLEELNLRRFIPNEGFFKTLNHLTKLKVCKLQTNGMVSDAVMALATKFAYTNVKTESVQWLDDYDYVEKQDMTTYNICLVRNN